MVIVYYRGRQDLERCLTSVLAQDCRELEVVLVDNASADRAAEVLAAGLGSGRPDLPVKVVRTDRNLGFAGGANAGLAAATGEFIFLLNPDAEAAPDCCSALVDAMADGTEIAAPRLLLADSPEHLDNCGHSLYPDGLNWCRGRGEVAEGRYLENEELLLFSGAAVMLRRGALARIGAFDPAYFAYGEDADLALRAGRLGLRCVYVPKAIVQHRVGGSFGPASLRKVFLVERNRARVALTHLPASWLLVAPAWTAARHAAMALDAASGRGLPSSWEPRTRWLLPLVVAAAHGASLLAAPGSLSRRWSLDRLAAATGGLSGRRWSARLRSQRIGLAAVRSRPAVQLRGNAGARAAASGSVSGDMAAAKCGEGTASEVRHGTRA